MKYDFTAVQQEFIKSGITMEQWASRTRPKIHCMTIYRAIRTGRANRKTAKAMIAPFKIPYESILPPLNGRNGSSSSRKVSTNGKGRVA